MPDLPLDRSVDLPVDLLSDTLTRLTPRMAPAGTDTRRAGTSIAVGLGQQRAS